MCVLLIKGNIVLLCLFKINLFIFLIDMLSFWVIKVWYFVVFKILDWLIICFLGKFDVLNVVYVIILIGLVNIIIIEWGVYVVICNVVFCIICLLVWINFFFVIFDFLGIFVVIIIMFEFLIFFIFIELCIDVLNF